MKNKKSILTASAYFFMPVLFAIIGYVLLIAALTPVWEYVSAAANLIISNETPVFNPQLTSMYVPGNEVKIDKQTEMINIADIEMPVSGAQYGNIRCDAIGLNAPLYWDDSLEILRYGAGQNISSFPPGFGRLLIIAGHNSTFFNPLQNIEVGQVIDIDTHYCPYQYEVTDVTVMDENELTVLLRDNMRTEEEKLYMYTCYPFTAHVGRRTDRLLVTGKRVSGYDVKWKE